MVVLHYHNYYLLSLSIIIIINYHCLLSLLLIIIPIEFDVGHAYCHQEIKCASSGFFPAQIQVHGKIVDFYGNFAENCKKKYAQMQETSTRIYAKKMQEEDGTGCITFKSQGGKWALYFGRHWGKIENTEISLRKTAGNTGVIECGKTKIPAWVGVEMRMRCDSF